MKKYLFIAAAALLALAACSKVVPAETPDKEVSFQVATYANSTKAVSLLSREEGLIKSFHTYAIYRPSTTTNGAETQMFMDNEEIAPDSETAPTKWSPKSHVYYWPKAGKIDFYSYAGTRTPVGYPTDNTKENSAQTLVFGEAPGIEIVNIATASAPYIVGENILVADAALNQNANTADGYKVDNAPTGVAAGVPTMFHHALAKVRFNIVLDATAHAAAADPKTKWSVTLAHQTLMTVKNQGVLTASYTYNNQATGAYIAPVSFDWAFAENGATAPVETKSLADVDLVVADGAKNNSPLNILGTGTDGAIAANEFVVIPQATTAIPLSLTLHLKSIYNSGAEGATDEVTLDEVLSIPANTMISSLGNISAWEAGHVYTYTIIVKPNEPIQFVPAVEDWTLVPAANANPNKIEL